MGFALWVDEDSVWAQGTHEYRPMGVAVVAAGGVVAARDFSPRRRAPERWDPRFRGWFASLGQMNDWLRERRRQSRSHAFEKNPRTAEAPFSPPF